MPPSCAGFVGAALFSGFSVPSVSQAHVAPMERGQPQGPGDSPALKNQVDVALEAMVSGEYGAGSWF